MNYKRWISGLCALALTALLPIAAAAEAPEKAPDTELIRELMENYLNMEKPQHESVQTQFGLVSKNTQLPMIQYEDFSRNQSGDGVCLDRMLAAIDADAGVYNGTYAGKPKDSFYDMYLYPEKTMWHSSAEDPRMLEWQRHQKYYVQDINGACYYWSGVQYLTPTTGIPVYYGFSSLPRKSYDSFLRKALENPEDLGQAFTLEETEVYDMEKKQAAFGKLEALSHEGYRSPEAKLAEYHHMTVEKRPCYGVSFDIPQEYLQLLNLNMLDRFFCLERRAYSSRQDAMQNEAAPVYENEHPLRLRAAEGDVHVTLYFDKDSRQCIGQRLDGTDCVKHMMDKVCGFGYVEATDGSYLVHSQYFENDFKTRPAFLTEAPAESAVNQAVFSVDYRAESVHHIYSTTQYGLELNFKTGLYEITDGRDVIGTLQYYSPNQEGGLEESMISASEELTSKTGLSYILYTVPMGKLFGEEDPNPSLNGYMAQFQGDCYYNGVLICAWDQDTVTKIMDDLSFKEETLPGLQAQERS